MTYCLPVKLCSRICLLPDNSAFSVVDLFDHDRPASARTIGYREAQTSSTGQRAENLKALMQPPRRPLLGALALALKDQASKLNIQIAGKKLRLLFWRAILSLAWQQDIPGWSTFLCPNPERRRFALLQGLLKAMLLLQVSALRLRRSIEETQKNPP